MTVKVSFIFDYLNSDNKAAGWSETWYNDGGHGETDMLRRGQTWCANRAAMLGNATSIVGFRVQTLGKRALMNFFTVPGGLTTNQDIPQMALEAKIYSASTDNVKYFQLRGVPDALVTSGAYTPSLAFRQALVRFGAGLNADSWSFQCQNQAIQPFDVSSIDGIGNVVIAGAPPVYAVGSKVTLLRARTVLGLNVSGTYVVEKFTDNNNIKLLGYVKGPVSRPCKIRAVTLIYPTVGAQIVPIQISTRKVGRPFFQYRGRARKR